MGPSRSAIFSPSFSTTSEMLCGSSSCSRQENLSTSLMGRISLPLCFSSILRLFLSFDSSNSFASRNILFSSPFSEFVQFMLIICNLNFWRRKEAARICKVLLISFPEEPTGRFWPRPGLETWRVSSSLVYLVRPMHGLFRRKLRKLPSGRISTVSKACGKTENLVTSGGLVQPGFLYPRLSVCKHNNTTRTKMAATISKINSI